MHSILTLVPSLHHFTLTVNVFSLLEALAPLTSTSWHTTGFYIFPSIFLLVHSLTQFQSFLCLIYMSKLGFLVVSLVLISSSLALSVMYGHIHKQSPHVSLCTRPQINPAHSLKNALSQNFISPIHNPKPKNQPVKTTKKQYYMY